MARVLLLAIAATTALAQDTLTLKTGEVLKGRVVTQTTEVVFFKWTDKLGAKRSKIFEVREIASLQRGGSSGGSSQPSSSSSNSSSASPHSGGAQPQSVVKLDSSRHLLLKGPPGSTPGQIRSAAKSLEQRLALYGYEGVSAKTTAIAGERYAVLEADAWTPAMRDRVDELASHNAKSLAIHKRLYLDRSKREQYQPGKRSPSGTKWVRSSSELFPSRTHPNQSYWLVSRKVYGRITNRAFELAKMKSGHSTEYYALPVSGLPKNKSELVLVIDGSRGVSVPIWPMDVKNGPKDCIVFHSRARVSVACLQYRMAVSLRIVPIPASPPPSSSSSAAPKGPARSIKIPPAPALSTGVGRKGHQTGMQEVRETITALKLSGKHSAATENKAWEAGHAAVQNWHRDLKALIAVGKTSLDQEEESEVAIVVAWWELVAKRAKEERQGR